MGDTNFDAIGLRDGLKFLAGGSMLAGAGDPEGNVSAPPGSLYLQSDGNVYRKASGSGNTGWTSIGLSSGALTASLIPSTTNAIDLGSDSKRWRDVFANNLKMGTRVTLTSAADEQYFNGQWAGKPGDVTGKFVSIEDDIFFGGAGSGVARGRFAAGTGLALLCFNTYYNGSALRALNPSKKSYLFELDADNDEFSFWRATATGGDQSFSKLSAIGADGSYFINSNRIITGRKTGWTAPSGTVSRSTFNADDNTTASGSYAQAEVQAIADRLRDTRRILAALLYDLGVTNGHGLIDV